MSNVAPEIAAALVALGVRLEGARWVHFRGDRGPRIFAAEFCCGCQDRFKRITMVPAELPGGRILVVGQCSECLTVGWSEWFGSEREWTGPRALEAARPMYVRGQGA